MDHCSISDIEGKGLYKRGTSTHGNWNNQDWTFKNAFKDVIEICPYCFAVCF